MIQYLAAAALLATQAAPSPQPCLTREEISDLAISLAPRLIGAVAQQCRPHLGPDAFLNNGGYEFLAGLDAAAGPRREAALRAFTKLSGGRQLQAAEQDAAWELMTAMLAGAVGGIPAESCADADRMIGALAPLPPANLGAMIAAGFALVQSGGGAAAAADTNPDDDPDRVPPPTVCPA